jgi:hypothetical protein
MSNIQDTNINGVTVLIETTGERSSGLERTSAVSRATETLQDGLEIAEKAIVGISERLVTSIKGMSSPTVPDELQIEFSIKVTAKGNVVVTQVGGEANFKVTLKYTKST